MIKIEEYSNIAKIYTWNAAIAASYDLFVENMTHKMAEEISLFISHLWTEVADACKLQSNKVSFILYIKSKLSKGIFYLFCYDFFHQIS